MAQPAVSQSEGDHSEPDRPTRSIPSPRERWPYAAVALASIAVFYMMWQPWMQATGWDGSATVTAFGKMRRTSRHLNLWSQTAPPGVRISSMWALLAAAAVVVVVAAAYHALRHGSDIAGAITAVAATAQAIFVMLNAYDLDKKIPSVQGALGMTNELGPQLGLIAGALRGKGGYPWPGQEVTLNTAGLTNWAFAAIAVALAAAAVAVSWAWRSGLRKIVLAAIGHM
ncbi:hypothetical protein ACFROC_20675 [Nocardia tengchongensis]|uniref:hypothetical protein n=1 Tax=Nocardia tengchongensis TaxID=2055889 RepID=UPI00367E712A